MSEICAIVREAWALGSRFGDSPTELQVEPKVPTGDGGDGHGVGEVAVHAQQIELQVEQGRIDGHTRQANQLELAQATQARLQAALVFTAHDAKAGAFAHE